LQEFVEIIYPLISTFKTLAGIHLTRAFFATYKPCVSIGIPGARVFMKLSFRFNLFVWRIHSKDPQVELPAELSIFSWTFRFPAGLLLWRLETRIRVTNRRFVAPVGNSCL